MSKLTEALGKAMLAEQKDLARGNDLLVPFRDQIARARKEAALTQGEAAQFVHVARRTWQAWEAGESTMPAITWDWFKLCAPTVGLVTGIRDLIEENEDDRTTVNSICEALGRAGFGMRKAPVRANGYEAQLSYDEDGNAIDLGPGVNSEGRA
jgi:DNA-binding XRE family transcriptional regulator